MLRSLRSHMELIENAGARDGGGESSVNGEAREAGSGGGVCGGGEGEGGGVDCCGGGDGSGRVFGDRQERGVGSGGGHVEEARDCWQMWRKMQ